MSKEYTIADLKSVIKEAIKESFAEIDEMKRKLAYEDAKARMIASQDLMDELFESMNPKTALGNHDFPINYESTTYRE